MDVGKFLITILNIYLIKYMFDKGMVLVDSIIKNRKHTEKTFEINKYISDRNFDVDVDFQDVL